MRPVLPVTEEIKSSLEALGTKSMITRIKADGDCLFNAVLEGAKTFDVTMIIKASETKAIADCTASDLRKAVVYHLRNNEDESVKNDIVEEIISKVTMIEKNEGESTRGIIEGDLLDSISHYRSLYHNSEKAAEDKSNLVKIIRNQEKDALYNLYLEMMERDGAWGGESELKVLAQLLDLKIKVNHTNDSGITIFNEAGSRGEITLLYNGSHYDLIEEKTLEALSSEIEVKSVLDDEKTNKINDVKLRSKPELIRTEAKINLLTETKPADLGIRKRLFEEEFWTYCQKRFDDISNINTYRQSPEAKGVFKEKAKLFDNISSVSDVAVVLGAVLAVFPPTALAGAGMGAAAGLVSLASKAGSAYSSHLGEQKSQADADRIAPMFGRNHAYERELIIREVASYLSWSFEYQLSQLKPSRLEKENSEVRRIATGAVDRMIRALEEQKSIMTVQKLLSAITGNSVSKDGARHTKTLSTTSELESYLKKIHTNPLTATRCYWNIDSIFYKAGIAIDIGAGEIKFKQRVSGDFDQGVKKYGYRKALHDSELNEYEHDTKCDGDYHHQRKFPEVIYSVSVSLSDFKKYAEACRPKEEEKTAKDISQYIRETRFPTIPQISVIARLLDFSGYRDLQQINLSGIDLRGANLRGACLHSTIMHNVYLVGADLTNVDLQYAELINAYLMAADFTGAKLQGADLSGADLTGAILLAEINSDTNLKDIKFDGMRYHFGLDEIDEAKLPAKLFRAIKIDQKKLQAARDVGEKVETQMRMR